MVLPPPYGASMEATTSVESDSLAEGLMGVGVSDSKPDLWDLPFHSADASMWADQTCCLEVEDKGYEASGESDVDGCNENEDTVKMGFCDNVGARGEMRSVGVVLGMADAMDSAPPIGCLNL